LTQYPPFAAPTHSLALVATSASEWGLSKHRKMATAIFPRLSATDSFASRQMTLVVLHQFRSTPSRRAAGAKSANRFVVNFFSYTARSWHGTREREWNHEHKLKSP